MPQLASCLCLLAWDWIVRCYRIKIPTSNLNFSNFSVISYICGKKWIIINYRELYITKRVRILLHQLWHFLRKPILTSFLDSLWSVLTMTSWWLITHLHIYAFTQLQQTTKWTQKEIFDQNSSFPKKLYRQISRSWDSLTTATTTTTWRESLCLSFCTDPTTTHFSIRSLVRWPSRILWLKGLSPALCRLH